LSYFSGSTEGTFTKIELNVESESVGAIALGKSFQSHDRYESEVNCFPMLLERYSNQLGYER